MKALKVRHYLSITGMVMLVLTLLIVTSRDNQSVEAAPSSGKKEIKDPAEYNAYMNANRQSDVKAKISGLEAFLSQYPNSVMKEDALEILMGTYQRAGNSPKALDTGQQVLTISPCNLRARSLLTVDNRRAKNLDEARKYSAQGIQCLKTATKPEDMSDEAWAQFKKQVAAVFNNTDGRDGHDKGTVVKVAPQSP